MADETGKSTCATSHQGPASGIEHRLFSAISQNWRGKPLVSHEVVVNLIGATTTRTGLRVQSQDTNRYPAGVSDDVEAIYLRRDSFHGEWNYSLLPRVALLN